VLLDLLGWGTPEEPAAAHIDLRNHREALIDALDRALTLADEDIEQIETVDAARAARHQPSTREATIKRVLELNEFASAVKEGADPKECR
jgi:hypothetical protein